MRMFPNSPVYEAALGRFMCIFALLLFLASVMLVALFIRQKRYRWLWLALPLLYLSYFMEQCFDMHVTGLIYSDVADRIVDGFASVPDWIWLTVCFASAVVEVLLLRNIHLCEKNRITTMSVKAAVDSLPTGILCYAPGAQTLLVNYVMQDFCRRITGAELEDGQTFNKILNDGSLLTPCKRIFIGSDQVIVLPDGTAWKISEGDVPYEGYAVRRILVSDITEVYCKTHELQHAQEKVAKLGKKLQKVNQEIVALTAEREVLNAKVKIHDELGSNLLAIKRFLVNGGTEKEKAELMETLRSSISFLKNDSSSQTRDEYELLISMAARLGLTISVKGELPQNEPQRAIITAAIHECFTNTLRHAHGNELRIVMTEDEEALTAVFSNNGEQPAGEVAEKGGLKFLRELTEQADGRMTIRSAPAFEIQLELPKEVEDAL